MWLLYSKIRKIAKNRWENIVKFIILDFHIAVKSRSPTGKQKKSPKSWQIWKKIYNIYVIICERGIITIGNSLESFNFDWVIDRLIKLNLIRIVFRPLINWFYTQITDLFP